MKVQVKITNKVTIEAEGDKQTDVFRQLAQMQEIFGQYNQCGKCKSEELKFVVRMADGNEFFEVRCTKCRAALSFGQLKKSPGSLFPHITAEGEDGKKKYLPDRGWQIFDPVTKTKK